MQQNPQKPQPTPPGVRKITIKRGGCLFPSVCLGLLLAIIGILVWLVQAGLPESALRAIEDAAAKQGIHLHIDKLRLCPAAGLAFEVDGLKLYRNKGDTETLVSLGSGLIEIRWRDLFRGNYHPKRAVLNDFRADFPVSGRPDTPLPLSTHRFAILTNSDKLVDISEGELDFAGVKIHVVGAIQIPESEEKEENGLEIHSLEDVLALIQPYTDAAAKILNDQNWQENEFPDIVITPAMDNGRQKYTLRVSLPKLEVDQFHLRDGVANVTVDGDTVSLDSLTIKTVEPDSTFSVRGGYNLETRELEARLNSDAPVLQMLSHVLGDDCPGIIRKFHHAIEDAPKIDLGCNLKFDTDFHPENIHLRVTITQKALSIGDSKVDEAKLSMRYDNGAFSIPECTLTLPDGVLRLTAQAKDGRGSAEFHAEAEVEPLLALASEFTDSPAALPDGIVLKGTTAISLKADLDVPKFEPGSGDWQNYVPRVTKMALTASAKAMDVPGCSVQGPELSIGIDGLEQDADLIPTSVGSVEASLTGESVAIPTGEDSPVLRLEGAEVHVDAKGIVLTDLTGGATAVSLGALDVKAGVETLDYAEEVHAEGLSLFYKNSALTLQGLNGESPSITATGMDAGLDIRKATHGRHSVQTLALKFPKGIGSYDSAQDWGKQLDALILNLAAEDIRNGERAIGSVDLTAGYTNKREGQAVVILTFTPDGGTEHLTVSATPRWGEEGVFSLHLKAGGQDMSLLKPLLEGVSLYGFQLPDSLDLNCDIRYNLADSKLDKVRFQLHVPEFVHEPQDVPGLIGKKAAVTLDANGEVTTAADSALRYEADLHLRHETGRLEAKIQGDTTMVSVTGTNSIRADIIDSFVDEEITHSVIRDFQFRPDTVTDITEIDTQVYFNDPGCDLRVKSRCRADIRNFSYMLFGIEDKDGKERVRTDLDPDPFAHVNRCSCVVTVNVEYGAKKPDGTPIKDTCTVCLSDATLEYDNRPWIANRRFPQGEPTSTVTGESVTIDIENDLVEIRNIRGRAYPAYAFGAFYADLVGFLEILSLPTPVDLETPGCVFPYASTSPKPFSGTISMKNDALCHLNFLGTSIPLEGVTGFIHFDGDSVLLDRLNAACWEGVVDAVVKFDFSGKHVSVDGYAAASCINLRLLAASYGSEQSDALCHGRIRFTSPTMEVADIKGYGDVRITDGNLINLRIFKPLSNIISDVPAYFAKMENAAAKAAGYEGNSDYLSDVLNTTGDIVGKVGGQLDYLTSNVPFANYFLSHNLTRANATFKIEDGHLRSRDLTAQGTNLTVNALLDLDLDTLELRGNLWPQIYSVPALILSPITFLSKYVIDIRLHGPIDDLKWSLDLDHRLKDTPPSATTKPATN